MSNLPVVFGGQLIIPAEWSRVLHSVQEYWPQANIAGGALRDLWHGKPAKDVDIFIPIKSNHPDGPYGLLEDALSLYKVDPNAERIAASIYGQSKGTCTPGFRNIYVIWRMNINDVIYEVIFIEDKGDDVIEGFDLSIAQIAYDGKSIRTTKHFNQTIFDKIIKVCNVNRSDRQTKRLERVLVKYPEYTSEVDYAEHVLYENNQNSNTTYDPYEDM